MRLSSLFFIFICIAIKMAMAKEVVLPVTFTKDTHIAKVVLNINGKPSQFQLDTGSQTALHLPLNTLQQLPDTTKNQNTNKSLDLSGKINETQKFLIKHLDINGLNFDNINAEELKPWGWSYSSTTEQAPAPDDNLPVIGLPLFQNHIFTLDFAHKKIIIDDGQDSTQINQQWIAFPYNIHPKEGIIINLTDQKKTYSLVLDTGASMSFIKGKSLPAAIKPPAAKSEEATLRLNKKGNPQTVKIILTNPSIRKIPIRAAIMDGMPEQFESDGLLGVDFLKKYSVKIDQKNQQLWIKPAF
ncbi:MAG: hypothetical protein J6571_01950 [Snodgrassella sp.]|jgi:hypothetical protein|uniref:hypothetical protein n=1 Tax=Snodgrassella sp. TaxID=2815304 RepID=UPI00258E7887|nr:hypothetical protein [Snodgrassella sp.]MCO6514122.1 hypothetical protein [Snodgrassella sp.]MCO6521943.1 hypothetical protein [Snodgrassella sp.]MCO6525657.1 hypothetical protein [Snodgrassella sp.]